MDENIKKYKLYILQLEYNKITGILENLENHSEQLNNLQIYDLSTINTFLNKIYDLIKNINTLYNEQIDSNNQNSLNEINFFLKNIPNEDNILKVVSSFKESYPKLNYFKKTYDNINELIETFGYSSIIELLEFAFNIKYNFFFSNDTNEVLKEINGIVIPISYSIFEVANETKDFYWRCPKKYLETDILERTRELWIKIPNKTKSYIKINLIFKVDKLSSVIKTCQINKPYLYKKKINILTKIQEENSIDLKFIKTLIRHDYLGNIYSMETSDYLKSISNHYFKYTKLIDMTFINLMKDFISNSDKVIDMYNIIFLLLLGDNDSIDIAGLLIGLLKEKKNSSKYQIYNFLINNFTFYLQSKIKKSNNIIKNEIEKIKNINYEDIDYKKQLVVNKNIPNNIKSMVLEKIEEMKSFNNEYYKQLTYVKTIINFPWPSKKDDIFFNSLSKNSIKSKEYLVNIQNKLKTLCYGHDEAKKTLLQVIGKWISNPSSQGTSIGLVGPPGVGKTLLAKSVSKALDIPFGEITLGGQNDGELLHGHGYTYSGSQPGMIIKKMVEMGKSRCILYFDELDKACSKHGNINEITSILIHLTDPNMNKNFQDRFFQGVDFPLNKVIMIFSYNDSSLVDPILLDRIKEIKVAPYTLTDKLNICRDYVVPEIVDSIKINNKININNDVLEYIINNYTNEAGVRSVKRKLEDIFLNLNVDKIFNRNLFKKNKNKSIILKKNTINDILSTPNKMITYIHKQPEIGIINGLYATTTGEGGIIPIQIFKNIQNSCGKYDIKLTGKQGDTMKESVLCSLTAAVEFIKKNKEKYNIDDVDSYIETHFKNGFHIHTPSTSTPKDGPSAGCAFTCCFISRILGKTIKNDVGMTGEVELTGNITKIGGLEFKLSGAKKAGVKMVYVPHENENDLNEIKKKYKNLISKDFYVKTFTNISDIIDDILLD